MSKPNRTGKKPIAQTATSIRIPEMLHGDVTVRAETFDEDQRTVEIIWAAGASVKRYSWDEGYYMEELSMDPKHIRMDRFATGMSLLDAHESWSMASRVGTILPGSAKVAGGKGTATVKLSRNQLGEALLQDLRDGHPFQVSVGYKTHAYERREGDENQLPVLRAIDWEPYELSAVPIPADAGAHSRSERRDGEPIEVEIRLQPTQAAAGAAATGESRQMPKNLAQRTGRKPGETSNPNPAGGEGEDDDEAGEEAADDAADAGDDTDGSEGEGAEGEGGDEGRSQSGRRKRGAIARRSAPSGGAEVVTIDPANMQAAVDAAAQRAIVAERQRSNELTVIGTRAGLESAFIQQHVQAGTSVAEFRNLAFDEMVTRQDQTATFPHSSARGTTDNRDERRQAVTNALLHRQFPDQHQLTEHGRNYRAMTLMEIGRSMLEQEGVRTAGMTRDELSRRFFHSTSDFPLILQNIIGTSLRQAYEAYPQTFQPFSRRTTAPDFKEIRSVQLSEGPRLLKVNEHGEYKRGTLKEGSQSYSIATYGRIVGVTRQLIINDDLGVMTRIPQLYGGAIAQLESDLVWDIIVANMAMSDGNALFSAAHGNVDTAAQFSAAAIGKLKLLLSKQKGMDGKTVLNLRPKYLVVAPELEFAAEQLLATAFAPTTAAGTVPQSIRSLTLISEPRLSAYGNGYHFTIIADPAQIDTIEYAYLEGQEGAYMETKEGWDVDGMEVKCRLDFGATAMDWKGFAQNPGVVPA